MPGENTIPQNCLKENCWLLDATSAKCFRKNVLMTLTQGHNFDLGFLTQGLNFDSLNDDSGSRFIYIWLSVDDFRVIGSGSDFKMDANSGLEFGILIDSGSDLKF
uniref:Uncharacterized protein n=1 Tax=Fagus sylvatica TaxID=28930 RepID=A0A2N9G3U8_FAGSY